MTFPFAMWSAAPFVERCFRPGLGGEASLGGGAERAAELRAFLAAPLGEGVHR